MTEDEKFQAITKKVIEVNPNSKTCYELIKMLTTHAKYKEELDLMFEPWLRRN